MIKHTVSGKENNKSVERILLNTYNIERNALYKAFRKKDIKINGKRISSNITLKEGDIIEAYVVLNQNQNTMLSDTCYYDTVFENNDVLIVSKKQGIAVSKNSTDSFSLIELINQNGKAYELCHRLDRNTGGLLIISKNREATEKIKEEINNRIYSKIYKCIVYGDATHLIGVQKAFLFKDSNKNRVYIYNENRKYAKEIITEIKKVKYDNKKNTSEVEINLITGRTHQIRAHLAHLGHFVIGDGKYGVNEINKQYGMKYQALWASALLFNRSFDDKRTILPKENFYSKPKYE